MAVHCENPHDCDGRPGGREFLLSEAVTQTALDATSAVSGIGPPEEW